MYKKLSNADLIDIFVVDGVYMCIRNLVRGA
jgi:hypothetical protein